MREETVRILSAINREFYDAHARAFSQTRARPWEGWQRLVPRLRELAARGAPLRVLDVGCGNGRFARFLADALPDAALAVHGVDASAALLAEARAGAPADAVFEALDVARHPEALPAGPFELVALFGVVHGIPARARRRALLRACAERVARGGRLVFTTWRVAHDPRLAGRRLDWARYNARVATPVDVLDLEPGDALLRWGEGDAVVRYFHELAEDELRVTARALPLACEERFRADGPDGESNQYLVFRAP